MKQEDQKVEPARTYKEAFLNLGKAVESLKGETLLQLGIDIVKAGNALIRLGGKMIKRGKKLQDKPDERQEL